jgi:Beta-ketoacyl synthase, C-terminal domain
MCAADALLAGRSEEEAPLILAASKSVVGHSEPASGLVGLLHAQEALPSRQASSIVHLVAINPYVIEAISQRGHGGRIALPRLQAAAVRVARDGVTAHATGVSAFAFQVPATHRASPTRAHVQNSWVPERTFLRGCGREPQP